MTQNYCDPKGVTDHNAIASCSRAAEKGLCYVRKH